MNHKHNFIAYRLDWESPTAYLFLSVSVGLLVVGQLRKRIRKIV